MLASKFRHYSKIEMANALSDDQIRRIAPSVFAEDAHESRSARYTYIPTVEVLNGLRREGFQPFSVVQAKARDEGRREFAKHMIRLRHPDQIGSREAANEIILLNSHDGTSSYQMLAGQFRFVCQNGLVCGDTVGQIRVPHKGNVIGNVIEGAFTVLDQFEAVNEQREAMVGVTLNRGEQRAFARAALAIKHEEGDATIDSDDLLAARRFEDRNDSLWTTFNRVQENMIRGGIRGRTANGRKTTTREIRGIDQNVKVNRGLWILAQEMARLKGE